LDFTSDRFLSRLLNWLFQSPVLCHLSGTPRKHETTLKGKTEKKMIEGMYTLERSSKSEVALLFIHGLGESSLCWAEAFSELPSQWHLLAIDLPGYGRSPRGDSDGRLHSYVRCLEDFIDSHLTSKRIVVVGHSFGADVGNLLSSRSFRVSAFASVEGALTPHDLFISQRVVSASSFPTWFEEFKEEICQMGRESPAFRRYFVSLNLADPDIFLESARSIVEKVGTLGAEFLKMRCPKRFFWGRESLADETRDFVTRHDIPNESFDAGHWIMIDRTEEFYGRLRAFILEAIGKKNHSSQ
jgi:pimeloyl-ACP methyl ester carboxylesterase